jgi:hypothetical protein
LVRQPVVSHTPLLSDLLRYPTKKQAKYPKCHSLNLGIDLDGGTSMFDNIVRVETQCHYCNYNFSVLYSVTGYD